MWIQGVLAAAVAALAAWGIHALVPALPLLTIAVALGIVVGQIPGLGPLLSGAWAPGLDVAGVRFMRLGIVLLGLGLSLTDIAALGGVTILTTILVVLAAFGGTWWFGRCLGLPGHQPLLIATGFSVCGASAIGAMSSAVGAKKADAAVPVALVTLCGTLAIAVLPVLWHPLGLSHLQFGHWVGAGVHDVGQVVATAQLAGPAALAVAVVVKLTRVLMLAPIVTVASVVARRAMPTPGAEAPATTRARRPPIVPLFVLSFLALVLVRTWLPVPADVLEAAAVAQTALLAMALFALGSGIRLVELVRTGGRALTVGLVSWALIAGLALVAVHLS